MPWALSWCNLPRFAQICLMFVGCPIDYLMDNSLYCSECLARGPGWVLDPLDQITNIYIVTYSNLQKQKSKIPLKQWCVELFLSFWIFLEVELDISNRNISSHLGRWSRWSLAWLFVSAQLQSVQGVLRRTDSPRLKNMFFGWCIIICIYIYIIY